MRFMLMFCQVAVAVFIFLLIAHDVSFERMISGVRMDRFTRRLLTQVFVSSTVISIIDSIIQVRWSISCIDRREASHQMCLLGPVDICLR